MIEYIQNPQQQKITNEYFLNILPIESTVKSNLNPIWSIQRCSKIFLHNENNFISQNLKELNFSPKNLTLHWTYSMNKCIDASPIIVLLDESREYVIIGSHAGLINAYEITNGQLIWSFQANDRIEGSGAISRNGEFVLIGKNI